MTSSTGYSPAARTAALLLPFSLLAFPACIAAREPGDEIERAARAASTPGLRIDLSWSAENSNVDAHLLHPTASHWISALDCDPTTCIPRLSWGAATAADDASLDGDAAAPGPERTIIETPQIGGKYRYGAYVKQGPGGTVTAQIHCGGSLVSTSSRGLGLTNQLWKVADIELVAPGGCVVTPIDEVITMGSSGAPR